MSWHPVTGFTCDGCGCPRMSDSECDPCSAKRANEFWETTRKRAAEYERRQRMPEEHARYRTALERLTSPSWHTNIEADMLAADDVDGVYAAAHATIDEVQAIAREALKEAK